MKKILLIFSFFLFFLISMRAEAAGKRSVSINPNGMTTITAHTSAIKIRVEIKTHEIKINNKTPKIIVSFCAASGYGFPSEEVRLGVTCSIVDNIDIFVNDRRICVPYSVFRDLGGLDEAEITIGEKASLLEIDGEAYNGYIKFDSKRVLHRGMYDPESGQLMEETTYHNKCSSQ